MVSGSRLFRRFIFCSITFLLLQNIPISFLSAQTNAEQVTLEVTILRAPPEVAKQILAGKYDNSAVEYGRECVTTDTPSIKDNSVAITTTPRYKSDVRIHRVAIGGYHQILDLLGKSKGCSVAIGPRTIISGDGKGFGFAGTAKTYCVSSEQRRAKFGTIVSVPEFQVIEEGTIAKYQLNTDSSGVINLDSQIVVNEILEVETFTFDGAARPITLELVTTKTRQLDINTNLVPGHVLIVPSQHIDNTFEQPIVPGKPFNSQLSYVSRLFKNVGVGRNSRMLYYVISTVP